MAELLFVYGSWTKPRVQRKVFRKSMQGHRDVLDGYCVTNIRAGKRMCPALIRKDCSSVGGSVIEVSVPNLARSDRYETRAFVRKRATLRSGKRAWVYVRETPHDKSSPHHPRFYMNASELSPE
jgi:gamma-glutamylcyclotransferase (GGCT)/AIG2-like uncharacterized protein YtfP